MDVDGSEGMDLGIKPASTLPTNLENTKDLNLNRPPPTMEYVKRKLVFLNDFNDGSNWQSNWKHTVQVADKPVSRFWSKIIIK